MTPATPRHVVRDPDSKKRRILEAARRLLVERGAEAVVLDEVAKRADVAKGTLFLHYKSKEELFAAAFADLIDALGEELDVLAKTGLGGRELLTAAAKVVLGHFDRSRDFLGQIGAGFAPGCGATGRGKLKEKVRANYARVRGLIERACANGRPPADPEFAASAFLSLCRATALRKSLEGRDEPLEAEAARVTAFFLDGSGASL